MEYEIHTDVKFGPLELVEREARRRGTVPWWNQTLCQVNDCVARLGVFQGEFHWHKHEARGRVLLRRRGPLLLDLEGRTVELAAAAGTAGAAAACCTAPARPSARWC